MGRESEDIIRLQFIFGNSIVKSSPARETGGWQLTWRQNCAACDADLNARKNSPFASCI